MARSGAFPERTSPRSRDSNPEPLGAGPALIRTGTLLTGIYEGHARELGLTPQQARLLFVVAEEPDNMLGLGATVRLGKSTMTSLVDRMEELGLLERSADARDRRRLVVTATARGKEVSSAFEKAMRASITTITSPLNEVELSALARILSVILVKADDLLPSE